MKKSLLKKAKYLVGFITLFLWLNNNASAQFRIYSNEFMNIGAGARGLSMGGAQVASVQDATAAYYNPARLYKIKNTISLSGIHAEYFSGIGKYDYLAGAIPLSDGKRTLGFSALRFAVEDIPNTLFLVDPQTGQLNYNNIKSFSSADYGFLFSYAQSLREESDLKMGIGGNAKILYRTVGSFANAWGIGVDLAFTMNAKQWFFGAMAKDITTTYNAWKFNFSDKEKEILYLTQNNIPVNSVEITQPRLVVGGGYNFIFSPKFSVLAEANLDFTFDGKRNTLIKSNAVSIDPKIGMEANISDKVFFRAGLSNFQQALADSDTTAHNKTWIFQPSIGTGIKLGKATIDYTFSNLANQSNPLFTHIFSLKIDIEKK